MRAERTNTLSAVRCIISEIIASCVVARGGPFRIRPNSANRRDVEHCRRRRRRRRRPVTDCVAKRLLIYSRCSAATISSTGTRGRLELQEGEGGRAKPFLSRNIDSAMETKARFVAAASGAPLRVVGKLAARGGGGRCRARTRSLGRSFPGGRVGTGRARVRAFRRRARACMCACVHGES